MYSTAELQDRKNPSPVGRVIFSRGQVKTEMYWAIGQVDFKVFFSRHGKLGVEDNISLSRRHHDKGNKFATFYS